MTHKYILEQRVIGRHLRIDITEERYNELAHARKVLSDALAFEQCYELLLGNFISMELAFTEICLRTTVEPQFRYPEIAETIRQANRHVVNVLTAMKAYTDQVKQNFKCVERQPPFKQVAKDELSKVLDRSPDYRFMSELRNYVQHKATAIHGFEEKSTASCDPNGWVEMVRFYATKASLSADKKFDARVLEEQPEKIDVRRCTRRSVQEIGVAHMALRKAIAGNIAQARSVIESAIHDYQEGGAESVVGLCATRDGDIGANVPVMLDWDDARLQLVEKNARRPRLWPTPTHREPKTEQIVALRNEAGHTQAQAAGMIFVPEALWRDYEDGLPMPEGLFYLYQLQVGRHPTHCLTPLDFVGGQRQTTR